jgi:hypothetical protein
MCATQLFEHIRGLRSSLVARFREQQAAVSTRSRAMNMSVPARYDVNFQLTIEDVRDIVRQLHERGDIGEAILAKHNHQIGSALSCYLYHTRITRKCCRCCTRVVYSIISIDSQSNVHVQFGVYGGAY